SLTFFRLSRGHPRDLHSFPTRRSSDLIRARRGTWEASTLQLFVERIHPRWMGGGRREMLILQGSRVIKAGDEALAKSASRDAHLDRKSTRLNSSHVKISYAVFCLKKKR